MNEEIIINLFKPFLYDFMNRYQSSKPNFKWVLVGGSGLEYSAENKSVIKSLDADIQFWEEPLYDPYPGSGMDITEKTEIAMEKARNSLADDLETRFKTFEGDNSPFKFLYDFSGQLKKTKTSPFYEIIRRKTGSTNKVMIQLSIWGYQISDIVYNKLMSNDYYTVGKTFNVIKVETYLKQQGEVMQFLIERGVFMPTSEFIFHMKKYSSPIKLLENFYKHKGNDFNAFIDAAGINKAVYLSSNYYQKLLQKTFHRVYLTLNRVTNYRAFKTDGTSCVVYKRDNTIMTIPGEDTYCESHVIIDSTIKPTLDKNSMDIDSKLRMDSNRPKLPQIKLIKSSYFNVLACHHYPDDKNLCPVKPLTSIPRPIPRNLQDALCDYTLNSSNLRGYLSNWYISQIFLGGNLFTRNNVFDKLFELLQGAFYKSSYDVTAYKFDRLALYNKNTYTKTLNVGDAVSQYFIQSASSTNKAFLGNEFFRFSNYQTNMSTYKLNIPTGSYIIYMGTDQAFTNFPLQFEILLPFGTNYTLVNKNDNSYVKVEDTVGITKTNTYVQLLNYEFNVQTPTEIATSLNDYRVIFDSKGFPKVILKKDMPKPKPKLVIKDLDLDNIVYPTFNPDTFKKQEMVDYIPPFFTIPTIFKDMWSTYSLTLIKEKGMTAVVDLIRAAKILIVGMFKYCKSAWNYTEPFIKILFASLKVIFKSVFISDNKLASITINAVYGLVFLGITNYLQDLNPIVKIGLGATFLYADSRTLEKLKLI